MNALRLNAGVEAKLYSERTGLELAALEVALDSLRARQLLLQDKNRIACTEHGHMFLNSVLQEFID